MAIKSKIRGNNTIYKDGNWYFEGTNELVSKTYENTPCGHCGKDFTKEGHDGCLGTLIGLMNACCGHGEEDEAFIQFWDGECIRGKDAIDIINILKKYSKASSEGEIKERQSFLQQVR